MAKDIAQPSWRNFADWGAVGGGFSLVILVIAITTFHQNALDIILRPTRLTAVLGLVLWFCMIVIGLANRQRQFTLKAFRNFLIQNIVAILAFLLVISTFGTMPQVRALSISQWAAVGTGATLIVTAILGSLATASARTNLDLIDDEAAAEEMRDRGRLYFFSFIWIAACGLLLIVLSLSGPGGLLPRNGAAAGALALIAIQFILKNAVRGLSDELGRTLSRESGDIAFHLTLVLGGGWAMLAQFGFVAVPAPLDWLTLLTLLMFAAGFIALGRRKLLSR